MLGYNKPLYILPFDHKTSFITKFFSFDPANLTREQIEKVKKTRQLVYAGFEKAIEQGIPKQEAAFLTDDEFGTSLLKDASAKGYITMLTTEKSGQKIFQFEHTHWQDVIAQYKPTFTKALVRYNPEDDPSANAKQAASLKLLSDYSHEHGYKFLIEPLVPATEEQLADLSGDKEQYDRQLRPFLSVRMIQELQEAGVEPDIWKLEGFDERQAYEKVVAQARSAGRNDVSIVILGRGGGKDAVTKWIAAGASVEGVTGFAVGRTVFYEPLEQWRDGKKNDEETILAISDNFFYFYTIFTDGKNI